MEVEASPSYFDPEDRTIREQFRRYRKKSPTGLSPYQDGSSSKFCKRILFYDGQNIHSPTNTALLLENFKEEADSYDTYHYEGTPAKLHSTSKRSNFIQSPGLLDADAESFRLSGSQSLKACKIEDDELAESGDTTVALFASLVDSALQGLMPIPDLILRFENSCRNVSESIRYGSNIQHRVVEAKLLKQKAQHLLDEAGSWSLLWHLFGKATEELPEELVLFPSTSHLAACQFVMNDHTAQLCLRIVQWLEGLASKALDLENKIRGSHVGTYLPNSGVWHHTQRLLKKGFLNADTVRHLDFDAPTREHAQQLPDDKKQDESLLEDVWTLVRAGRVEEACNLCRSAGQPWRAATLCPFGGMDLFPSAGAFLKNGKNRTLQAIELDGGIGIQYRLWKWASYYASEKTAELDSGKYETAVYASQCSNVKRILPICTDWESACWAMAKAWLDIQVDLEIAPLQTGSEEQFKTYVDGVDGSAEAFDGAAGLSLGPEKWPLQVIKQQPQDVSALLQKLHSGEMVHEAVARECKEQHRQIQMNIMLGDIAHLLDMIWSWIAPVEYDQSNFRPHGDPQMIRFGAHVVLVLRSLLGDEVNGSFRERLMNTGDLILHMYVMFLFSKQHEELVGIYASQLVRHRCVDLFVHMMELRLDSSVHVKYKLFLSAMEYLPFSSVDNSKGSFEEIVERVLSRSREVKHAKYDHSSDVAEQHRQQSLLKAVVIQWLCFTPPSTIKNVDEVSSKLLMRALMHSNILFREFALISMWRVPEMPIGAHKLLSFLAEPLKQLSENSDMLVDYVSENLEEFQAWNEYYSCDAKYRNWLKVQLENTDASPDDLYLEEKQRVVAEAQETWDSSLMLLLRRENPWLTFSEDHFDGSEEPLFLKLHATAMLCLPSGECLHPEAAVCAALMSALYYSVSEETVSKRQLTVNVCISSKDNYCIEVVLQCLAVEGDGLGTHELHDGGLLSGIMAAGFKGELPKFQAGVTLEISRMDAWYCRTDGTLEAPATFMVRGLCRRCCLPELILRSLQVCVSLAELGNPPKNHDELIELVSCTESGYLDLFSEQQLQEFLLLEREFCISQMELQEEPAS